MRKLTKEEKELTEKGIKRLKEELREMMNNVEYNKALIDKQKYLRNFDDLWRDFLREQKDEQDKALLKQMDIIIEQKQEILDSLNRQLTEGVEEKIPTGVG